MDLFFSPSTVIINASGLFRAGPAYCGSTLHGSTYRGPAEAAAAAVCWPEPLGVG